MTLSSHITTKKPSFNKWLVKTLTNHSTVQGFIEPVMQIFNPKWQAQGYFAQVVENRAESKQVFTLVLQPQKSWPTFIAGQHIELQVEINGTRYTRIFSISSSPDYHRKNGLIELTIRQQDHGKVTPWLSSGLTQGSPVRISSARGKFTLPKANTSLSNNKPLLFIAGGSGITPFRSLIHHLADNHNQQDIHLIYYNHAVKPLFADEWSQIENRMPHLKVSLIDTKDQGQINQQQLEQICPDFTGRLTYICGPYGLITNSQRLLLNLGVNESHIQHELFGPKPIKNLSIKNNGTITFKQSQSKITAKANHNQTLLELAEANDVNPTSGCRMGVCHQCKCRKKQGVVYNTLTESFSDTAAEDIQLCISVAVGDVDLEL